MFRLRLAKISQSFLVLALSLWVAGAGCMLGCEGMVARANARQEVAQGRTTTDLAVIVSGDACASKSHDCCASRRHKRTAEPIDTRATDSTVEASPESSTGMQDCPLAVNRGAVATSTKRSHSHVAVIAAAPNAVHQHFSELVSPVSAKLRLPNRAHTYLRCCAFLI